VGITGAGAGAGADVGATGAVDDAFAQPPAIITKTMITASTKINLFPDFLLFNFLLLSPVV